MNQLRSDCMLSKNIQIIGRNFQKFFENSDDKDFSPDIFIVGKIREHLFDGLHGYGAIIDWLMQKGYLQRIGRGHYLINEHFFHVLKNPSLCKELFGA